MVAGRPPSEALPPLPVQYADFSVWQSRRLSGETLQREIEHWREKLAGAPPFLELPTDRPRPPVQTFGGRSLPLWLEPELAGRLSALALETGTTLFMVLLAGFETLLGIYSGAEDLAVAGLLAAAAGIGLEFWNGFPQSVIDEFIAKTGVPGILGNSPASGLPPAILLS